MELKQLRKMNTETIKHNKSKQYKTHKVRQTSQKASTHVVKEDRVVPKNVVIETVFGCNAKCIMCPIEMPAKRKKGVMSSVLFKRIIDELAPYYQQIDQIDLFGVGEPLLDKGLPDKVKYAKEKGFQDVGLATNADLLGKGTAYKLFEAGLDNIMISIDGITAEVHEGIRVNTSFERVIKNVKKALALRDECDYQTKFVFRFIRQSYNNHQWFGFKEYWTPLITKPKGDLIIGYNMHSWGGEIEVQKGPSYKPIPGHVACHHLFDRIIILRDGTIPLCCADMHHANYALGNVKNGPLMEIYNNSIINEIRKRHQAGDRLDLDICADCTVLESEMSKDVI